MTRCWVTVGAYLSLSSALTAWDAIARTDQAGDLDLVDATLVEGDADTIRVVHRQSAGPTGGALSTAVVGLLRPPAIVTGAVAGGVGGHALTAVGKGLTRRELRQLGDALDAGPIGFVGLITQPSSPGWEGLLDGAVSLGTVELATTVDQIRVAVARDARELADVEDDEPFTPAPAPQRSAANIDHIGGCAGRGTVGRS